MKDKLTKLESTVYELVCQGKSREKIALALEISEHKVMKVFENLILKGYAEKQANGKMKPLVKLEKQPMVIKSSWGKPQHLTGEYEKANGEVKTYNYKSLPENDPLRRHIEQVTAGTAPIRKQVGGFPA